jgi:hypothetical protein
VAVDKDRHSCRILDAFGDQEGRSIASRVRQNVIHETERREARRQFILEIRAKRGGAFGLLA